MKKDEFLRELEQRLSVLNDSERLDIIEEYSQHIDLKIANGMDEDCATGDFGDIKTLADEILSAYNVNLKYNHRPIIIKIKDEIIRLYKIAWKEAKHFGKSIISYIHSAWHKITDSIKEIYIRFFKKESKDNISEKDAIRQQKKVKKVVRGKNIMIDETKNVFSKFFHNLAKFLYFGWNFLITTLLLLLSVPFITMCLFCLLFFGVLLISLPQGYPFLGLTIIVFGFGICAFATAGIILSYYKKIKVKKSQDHESEQEPKQEPEIGGK